MKGTLHKTEQGWVVIYFDTEKSYDIMYCGEPLPLHSSDHITNKTQRIEGKEVEFEIVEEIPNSCYNNPLCDGDKNCTKCHIKYAKIINTIDVEKLAKDFYVSASFEEGTHLLIFGFIDGYSKAQETLYTEEQIIEAIRQARMPRFYHLTSDEIIQSLKQPK